MDVIESSSTGPSFLGTFALALLAMAALFAIDTFLARVEQSESRTEAARLFEEGRRLVQQGDNLEAIDRFRTALSISRGNREYQLALARALLAASRLADAGAVLTEMLQQDSTDGPANLIMARVLLKQGKIAEVSSYYHRAIYGQWKEDAAGSRVKVRFELIDFLVQQDAKKDLLAELLSLQDEAPADIETRKRTARLYLLAGSPSHASEMFREVLRRQPQDPDAYSGLGEAELAKGNCRTAQAEFLIASRLKPNDAETRKRLALCNEILALDPMQRGLSSSERYRRSLRLVGLSLDVVNQCVGASPPQAVRELVDKANRVLKRRVKAYQQDDATETNIELAEQLWQARTKHCKQAITAPEEPLALVLAKAAQ